MDPLVEQLLTNDRLERFRRIAATRLNCLTLLSENLTDPHNISACIRSAEAFGLPSVHVVSPRPYEINEHVSQYADRWLDVQCHDTAQRAVESLRARGFILLGTVPNPEAPAFSEISLPAKIAVLAGNEADGLSDELLAACDAFITIPMSGFTPSLNISVATAILLQHFSAVYRRRRRGCFLPAAEQARLVECWCRRDVETKTRGQLSI